MAFGKDVVITFGTRCSAFLFALANSAILARVLGPEGRGILAICLLVSGILASLGGLGISRAFIYYNGKGYYPYRKLVGATITIVSVAGVLLVAVGGAAALLLGKFALFHDIPKAYIFTCLFIVPFNLLYNQCAQSIFLSLEKIKLFNLVALIQAITLLILYVVFLLGFKSGVLGGLVANILAVFLILIVSFVILSKFCNVSVTFSFDKKIIKSLLTFGYRVYWGALFGFFHLRIVTFIVAFLLGPVAVGYYVIAVGLVEKLWLLSHTVSTVFYPKIANMPDEGSKTRFTAKASRNILFVTAIGACFLFFLSKLLVVFLYTREYLPSVNLVKILLIGITAVSLDRILGNDLIARNRATLNSSTIAICLLLNIALNFILIPRFELIGAAWATSISYSVSCLLKLYAFCRLSACPIGDVILMKKSDLHSYIDLISSIRR